MQQLPDFAHAYEYENQFYLTCDPKRIGKLIAQYHLFAKTRNVPGDIIEFGVFKGASLARLACFLELFHKQASNTTKVIHAFDTFDHFPEAQYEPDHYTRAQFIEAAGSQSLSVAQLKHYFLPRFGEDTLHWVDGDILNTLTEFLARHPEKRFSLINIDVDLYEPTQFILQHVYPRMNEGSIIMLDDYQFFPGATKAIDDFADEHDLSIEKMPFCDSPYFLQL